MVLYGIVGVYIDLAWTEPPATLLLYLSWMYERNFCFEPVVGKKPTEWPGKAMIVRRHQPDLVWKWDCYNRAMLDQPNRTARVFKVRVSLSRREKTQTRCSYYICEEACGQRCWSAHTEEAWPSTLSGREELHTSWLTTTEWTHWASPPIQLQLPVRCWRRLSMWMLWAGLWNWRVESPTVPSPLVYRTTL